MLSARRVFACLCIAVARGADAQGVSATIVLEHPASARALALGDAMVAVRDGDAALFTNPALLEAVHGASSSVSGQRYLAGSSLAAASGAVRLLGGTLGIGLRGLNYGSVSEYVPDTANFGGQRGVATGRDVSASELAVTAGYARAAHRLHVGAAIGYVRQQIADATGGAATVDLGVAANLARGIIVGATVQQLGSDLTLAGTSSPLPRAVRVGASLPLRRGSLGSLLMAEGVRKNGDTFPRGGVELSWRTANGVTIVARGGMRGGTGEEVLSRYTFGAGIATAHIALDVASQRMGALGGAAHRVGLRFQR